MAKKKTTKKKTKTTKKNVKKPKIEVQEVEASRCKRCGSTDREGYYATRTLKLTDRTVTWKNTRCKSCGLRRIDKFVDDHS